jgi:hypothetical protein
MRKCANISPDMRRPLVIATAPFWISLCMRKILFSFLSVHTWPHTRSWACCRWWRCRTCPSSSPPPAPIVYWTVSEFCNSQRVLNEMQRARLACGRMIQLQAQTPSPLSRQQVASLLFLSPLVLCQSSLLAGKGGGGWGGGSVEPNYTTAWPSINRSMLSVQNRWRKGK